MFHLNRPGTLSRERHFGPSKYSELQLFLTGCLSRKKTFLWEHHLPPPGSTMASTPKGIDVVGVDNGSHGRSCTQHSICGHFVVVDDKLYCKWAVQSFNDEIDAPEACVQVYKLAVDGNIGCHVGYLPRRLVKASRNKKGERDGGKSYEGTWLKVVKDLRLSENSSERSRSYRNCGILYCHVANDTYLVGKDPFETTIQIPQEEIKDASQFNMPSSPESDFSSTCTPDVHQNSLESSDDEEENK